VGSGAGENDRQALLDRILALEGALRELRIGRRILMGLLEDLLAKDRPVLPPVPGGRGGTVIRLRRPD